MRLGTRWAVLPAVLCFAVFGPAKGALGVHQEAEDEWLTHPVDDATFRTYLEFFTYDADFPLDVEVTALQTSDGIRRERLSFVSTAGQRVTAVLVRSASDHPAGRPAAVLTHGGGAAGKDGASTQAWAALLARAGWVVLAIDLWHYGDRNDGLLVTFTQEEKNGRLYSNHANYLEFIIQSAKDVGRSVDYLVGEQDVDPERIIYVGLSRGAVVGTIVGAVETRLAGVALVFGGHRQSLAQSHVAAACPANYIGRISPRHLLMLNGTEDTIFSRESAVVPLQRLVGEPHEFLWFETGHGGFSTPETMAALMSWLAATFPR
jgi:poly(3-hydroxybutyrate) depolymerase